MEATSPVITTESRAGRTTSYSCVVARAATVYAAITRPVKAWKSLRKRPQPDRSVSCSMASL